MGKLGDTIDAAKTHRCVVVLDPGVNEEVSPYPHSTASTVTTPRASNSLYVVTGGDNGGLFLWKGATCLRAAVVIPGGG